MWRAGGWTRNTSQPDSREQADGADRGMGRHPGRRAGQLRRAERPGRPGAAQAGGRQLTPQPGPGGGRHFLQTPGPSDVPGRVLRALSRPTIDHRGPEFAALTAKVLAQLKRVFRTEQPVIVHPW